MKNYLKLKKILSSFLKIWSHQYRKKIYRNTASVAATTLKIVIRQINHLRRTNRTFTLHKSIKFVANILAHKKPTNNLLILEYIKLKSYNVTWKKILVKCFPLKKSLSILTDLVITLITAITLTVHETFTLKNIIILPKMRLNSNGPTRQKKYLTASIVFSLLLRNLQLGYSYHYVEVGIEIESDPLFSNFHRKKTN